MRAANLALKFLLELAAGAALAVWGASVGDGAVPIVLGIAAPLAMFTLWGLFAAPRAGHRLPAPPRILFELGVFAVAGVALGVAGYVVLAGGFVLLVAANAALLTRFAQWEA